MSNAYNIAKTVLEQNRELLYGLAERLVRINSNTNAAAAILRWY